LYIKYSLLAGVLVLAACDSQDATKGLDSYPHVALDNTYTIPLDSQITPAKYQITIALPANYNESESQDEHYPVVYLLDSEYAFAIANSLMQFLGGRKVWDNTIIVGVGYQDNPENYWPNRNRDYTPVARILAPGYGEADAFLRSLKEEIFPLVESTLRVEPQRTLVGYSYGGLFATYTALVAPEVFSNYVMISPSLWFGDYFIFDLLQDITLCDHDDIRLVMSIGSEEDLGNYEMVSDLNAFINILRNICMDNIDITELFLVNQTHMTVYPEAYTRSMKELFGLELPDELQ